MRRVVLSLVMLAVMMPLAAFARTEYLCRIDGKTRDSCCCPKPKQTERTPSDAPTLRRADCCEVTTTAAEPTTAVPAPPAVEWTPPALVVTTVEPPPIAHVDTAIEVEHHALDPPPPRSLLARHCTLLL